MSRRARLAFVLLGLLGVAGAVAAVVYPSQPGTAPGPVRAVRPDIRTPWSAELATWKYEVDARPGDSVGVVLVGAGGQVVTDCRTRIPELADGSPTAITLTANPYPPAPGVAPGDVRLTIDVVGSGAIVHVWIPAKDWPGERLRRGRVPPPAGGRVTLAESGPAGGTHALHLDFRLAPRAGYTRPSSPGTGEPP